MRGNEFVAAWTDENGKLQNAVSNPPTDHDLLHSERTVLHYITVDGEDKHFTVLGGFDTTFTPADAIEAAIEDGYPKAG